MPYEYSDSESELKPYVLELVEEAIVGKIIRACAELDDIVTLWLCECAQLSEGHLIFLAPRMQITAKIEAAGKFAKFRGGDWESRHKEAFCHEDFQALIKCRNIVAHGSLLGKDSDGGIVFRVPEYLGEKIDEGIAVEAFSYSTEQLANFAGLAQVWVKEFEEGLKLQSLREKRRERPLGVHPKVKRNPSR